MSPDSRQKNSKERDLFFLIDGTFKKQIIYV